MAEWYEELREHYKPDRLRVLLVGESPPDPGDQGRRFFYSPTLTRYDNLYRGVAAACYGTGSAIDVSDKAAVLERLRCDGLWLIDATDTPIDKLTRAERRAALRASCPGLVERVRASPPELGVIICKAPLFELVAPILSGAGIVILHSTPIPFPLGNHRARFISTVAAALNNAGWSSA
jgi:hypothetical protein